MILSNLFRLIKNGEIYIQKRVRAIGYSVTEHTLCSYVYHNPNCTQEDIVRSLFMDKTTVAKTLVGLEKRGIVSRSKSKLDKRRNQVILTEKGHKELDDMIYVYQDWMARVVEGLPPEELEIIEKYSTLLYRNALELNRQDALTFDSAFPSVKLLANQSKEESAPI